MNKSNILREIKKLSERGDYENALKMCEEILIKQPADNEVLREKSSALIGIGKVEMAIEVLTSLSNATNEPSDYFDLARASIRIDRHHDAIQALDHVIEIGENENFDYYLSSALFLRAFSLVEINEKSRAKSDISRLPDDMKFWIPGKGLIDLKHLRSRI